MGPLAADPQNGTASRQGVQTASDVMVTIPKTLESTATVGQIRAAFADDHVHMLLLTKNGRLEGTLIRSDVPETAEPPMPALPFARLAGRQTTPATPVPVLISRLEHMNQRRLAVVDSDGILLGLVCFKRTRKGFCSDADVRARQEERLAGEATARASAPECLGTQGQATPPCPRPQTLPHE